MLQECHLQCGIKQCGRSQRPGAPGQRARPGQGQEVDEEAGEAQEGAHVAHVGRLQARSDVSCCCGSCDICA